MGDETQPHWESVYRRRAADEVSWYRPHLDLSLELLRMHGLGAGSRVLDVGGGASTLVDDLLEAGVADVHVLDLSEAALAVARERLGGRAARVRWIVGDITNVALAPAAYTHWHDRAVLHFLTGEEQARAYAQQAARAIAPGGVAVIGGFAPDGPERCSGLMVARRSAEDIAALMGESFELIDSRHEVHRTPGGNEQAFAWAVLRRH
jgi:SAM-dependent methyltransferase